MFYALPEGAALEKKISLEESCGKYFTSVIDLAHFLDLEVSFNIITGRGKLYRKNHFAIYSVGFSVMIIDGRLFRSSSPVFRKNGAVYLPEEMVQQIASSFYPDYNIKRGIKKICLEKKDDLNKKHPANQNGIIKNSDNRNISAVKDRISFIIIDAGHGGKDPGAIGRGGLKEKTITLSIAKKLSAILEKEMTGITINHTRTDDRFIELAERTNMANRWLRKGKNGLFVSVHINASISHRISGFETYFLSQNPSNEEARNTAALENNVVVLEDKKKSKERYHDVDYVEAMMLTTQIQKESSMLATSIQNGIDRKIRAFKSRGVKKADFFVLRGSLMPAVLVEAGYITNRKEAGYLKKAYYQKKIARGIADGVKDFIKKYNRLIGAR